MTESRVQTVGLNALFLAPGVSSGPETYLRGLVPALVSAYPRTCFALVTTRAGERALERDGWRELLDLRSLPAEEGQRLRRTAAEQMLLPRMARREGWDVLHSLASIAPIRPGACSVITLHDVIFFRHRTFGLITRFGMRALVARAAPRADALIAPSAASREEICEVLGVDPARVAVVANGLGRPPTVEPAPEPAVRERYGLGGAPVVLCVAAKRPHKNQELLVRAIPHLPEGVLVLAGHPEPYDAKLRHLAGELGVEGRVRFTDYVSDADLETLWRLAACAVFPSLAEGFGLPVLEAMARGVPVACSDIPVFREIADGAARYFDPRDPRAAAAVIVAAMADGALAAAGRERAGRYSWEATAHGTFEAYERAMLGRRLTS